MTQLNEKNVTVPKMLEENKTLTQIINEKSSNETVKMVRERSSGPNIHDTEKIVLSKNSDGKVRKRLVLKTVDMTECHTKTKHSNQTNFIKLCFCEFTFFLINLGRCEINITVLQHTGSNGVIASPTAEIRFDI